MISNQIQFDIKNIIGCLYFLLVKLKIKIVIKPIFHSNVQSNQICLVDKILRKASKVKCMGKFYPIVPCVIIFWLYI